MINRHIAIVIILYKPLQEHIEHICQLSKKWEGAIVDNSDIPTFNETKLNKMFYIPMNENVGIAKAQNVGIKKCLENTNTELIVFLDQDSKVNIEYPQLIAEEFNKQKKIFPKLCIIGPTAIDKYTNEPYKSRIHKETFLSDALIIRSKIISSGACTSRSILKKIGPYEEKLFIDLVDSEWCWRACFNGYLCGISPLITIKHHIGHKVIHFWKFSDIIPAPERYYYIYRNYLWLLPRNYVPIKWKLTEGLKNIVRLAYIPFVRKDWKRSSKYIWKGIMAGIKY